MKHIEKQIVINAPLRLIYNQWTQFEEFPLFIPEVLSVQQLDDRHVFWHVDIWGKEVGWVAEIHEQIPDRSISWRSVEGRTLSGIVSFERISDRTTTVRVALDYEVKGAVESICDALGAVESLIDASLRHFRDFIESRALPTGAWRGEIRELAAAGGVEAWTRY